MFEGLKNIKKDPVVPKFPDRASDSAQNIRNDVLNNIHSPSGKDDDFGDVFAKEDAPPPLLDIHDPPQIDPIDHSGYNEHTNNALQVPAIP